MSEPEMKLRNPWPEALAKTPMHFCPGCNRLRISAEGRMKTCLFDHDGVDIRCEIRGGADLSRLREIIEGELERKRREGHKKPPADAYLRVTDHMSRIGG